MSTFHEGFWESKEEPYLPHPREFQRETPVDAAWLEKFAEVEFWARKHYFLGYSPCRFCDKDNGCATYVIEHGADTWVFPEGLCHYFKEHNVHPSRSFYKFVLAYRRPTADEFVNSLLLCEQVVSQEIVLPSQRFHRFALAKLADQRAGSHEQTEEQSREIAVLVKLAISAADQYPQDIRERLQSPTFVDSLSAQIQMHLQDDNLFEKFKEQVVQGEVQKLFSGTAELSYSN